MRKWKNYVWRKLIKGKLIFSTEEKETFGISNKATASLSDELTLEHEQLIFQDLENFFRTIWAEEDDVSFF